MLFRSVTYLVDGQHVNGVVLQNKAAQTSDWNTEASPVDLTTVPQRLVQITSSSVASPTTITCPKKHGLVTGQKINVLSHVGSTPDINGEQGPVTVTTDFAFTIPVNVTVGGTGGGLVQANTVNGGLGFMQVFASSGFTNFVGKVRDSDDDITYADLITFPDSVAAPYGVAAQVAGTEIGRAHV